VFAFGKFSIALFATSVCVHDFVSSGFGFFVHSSYYYENKRR
jgi:hypothetical protein